MTRRSMFSIAAVLASVLAITLALHAQEKKSAVVSGTWKYSYQGFGGNDVEVTIKLKQDGDKLTGTITQPPQNQEVEIKDGMVKDDKVSFKVVGEFGGQTRTTTYTGTLSGDSLKGKSETVFSRDFDAKKAGN